MGRVPDRGGGRYDPARVSRSSMVTDPGTLVFRRSRFRTALILPLVPVMVGASYWAAVEAPDPFHRAVGWIGVVFFGAATFPIVHALLKGGIELTMDANGFTDRRRGLGPIPWTEVAECFETTVHGQRLLCFRLRNPDLLFDPMPVRKRLEHRLNQRVGFGDVVLSFQALRPSMDEALSFIRALGS